jgi:type I restriction enzyme, S subunit
MSNKPNPEMRDTQIQWLGEVPVSWDIRRLKHCLELVNEKLDGPPAGESYIGLENIESNTGRVFWPIENGTAEGSCNVFKPGDVLFGKLRPYLAKATIMETGGVCSTELLVFRPRKVDAKFLWYFLLSEGFIKTVDSSTYGAKMPRASWEFIGNLPMLVPHIDEQKNISQFLDTQTTQIDELIALKEKQIELLDIKRQTIICQAVTRGLDLNVPMKPSGISWMGNVPNHWRKSKVNWLFSTIGSGTTPSSGEETYYDGDFPWVITGDLNDGYIDETSKYIAKKAFQDYSALKIFPAGTLLIAMYGATIGKVGILNIEASTNQACCALANPKNVNPKFMFYWFIGNRAHIISMAYGGGQPNISQELIKQLRIYIPDIEEQNKIADNLNDEIAKIERIIRLIVTQIKLLRQYRQTLITNSVTGKIDLRGVDI